MAKTFKSKFDTSYVPGTLKQIERKWKGKVDSHWNSVTSARQQKTGDGKAKYILSMFPYPSGQLHLGHIRIYTTSDILFKTSVLCGENTVHPMGFDSFGLPAENAAKLHNQSPFRWTESNVEQMKGQLANMGYHFHWREITSDPAFYRWTQWLFIQLFKAGLAYQGVSQVNWDPVDCTVLADEQVDAEGRSWRSGAPVEKRFHKQWLVKTNAFADDLFKGEDILDTGHWSFILATQRWWIKKANGYLFYLQFSGDGGGSETKCQVLQVFTKHPELFHSPKAFIGISQSHWLAGGRPVNSLVGQIANPFVEGDRPLLDIRVVDSGLVPKSTQATLLVLREAFEDEPTRREVVSLARSMGLGGYFTSDTYRDWLISRQRFWGTPIPIVHCRQCGPVPEREERLPVVLPHIADYSRIAEYRSADIASPLKHFAPEEWLKTECPSCGSPDAHRETDTCDTFFDSSWYFLRYFGRPASDRPFADGASLQPVYCYVGGKEHAALHLFYARFITHFLYSKGFIGFREPFRTLLMQAIVKGRTYRLNGRYISAEEAARHVQSSSGGRGEELEVTFEKMSKSKGTGVNPDELVAEYGADAVRWTMTSVGNPESERLWADNEKEFGPTLVFFHRILLTIEEFIAAKRGEAKLKTLAEADYRKAVEKLSASTDQQVFNVLYSLASSYQIRNGTTTIHRLTNSLRANMNNNVVLSAEFERGLASLLVMISPFVPCFAAECWQAFTQAIGKEEEEEENRLARFGFDTTKNVYEQAWPRVMNPEHRYIVRFTYRDEAGKEQECSRITVPLRQLGSWSEEEIRHLLAPFEEEIEWIDIVKHCSVVVRVRDEQAARQLLGESQFEVVQQVNN